MSTSPPRDLQSLCDRLAEIFNADDDTPCELCTEAREAIEELWEERDRLRSALTAAAKDAARYRWLKQDAAFEDSTHAVLFEVSTDEWDATIDAILAKETTRG